MKFSAKKECLTIILSFFLFFKCSSLIYGQAKDHESDYFNWFDQFVGLENTPLYNGLIYVEKYKMINEKHKFFQTQDFLTGSIIFEEQPYFDIRIKYDLYEDQVLVNLNSTLQLDKRKIGSFTINQQRFTKISGKAVNGFFEILLEAPFFTFLKKHKKIRTKRIEKKTVYYEFTSNNKYYLSYKDIHHLIKNKGDIVKVFPEFKKEINNYASKSLRKLDKETYLVALLNQVHTLISKENTN